jgi:hypothetical protein
VSTYTPYLAWATQFYFLVQFSRSQNKVLRSLSQIEQEISDKEREKEVLLEALKVFDKEDMVAFLTREMEREQERFE